VSTAALWKYLVIAVVPAVAFVYALPNYFGEAPAVEVTSAHPGRDLPGAALMDRGREALAAAGVPPQASFIDRSTLNYSFASPDAQLKARDALAHALNPDRSAPDYVVAVDLLPRAPRWLAALGAAPMNLGLDLRGGVHFLLQVDTQAAIRGRLDSIAGDLKAALRGKDVRPGEVQNTGDALVLDFPDAASYRAALPIVRDAAGDAIVTTSARAAGGAIRVALGAEAARRTEELALRQNLTILHNRINELGVAEPLIEQQGADRVVVELPGIQDTARAKAILGRTAALEVRLVDDGPEALAALAGGPVPPGDQAFRDSAGRPIIVHKEVLLTGAELTDAEPGFDPQTREPVVFLTLNGRGARVFGELTRANVGRRLAMILFDHGEGEVVTAPVIRSAIPNGRVEISGRMTLAEANDTALLLRAGALAAPMQVIEERTIGPSLGRRNIARGFHSVAWGFAAIVAFMCAYYLLFGAVSSVALAVNLLVLVALLSVLQATLTLPGIAAMALALGMAIDANVLINERIREELRAGLTPRAAIVAGYRRAWATIVDSNVTTLIAGLALLAFGSGAVRGFAVVHVLGILTSMFSAVFLSRALVDLVYGGRRRLERISIGAG